MKKIIAGNWKMNFGSAASKEFLNSLIASNPKLEKSEIWVTPSFTSLETASEIIKKTDYKLGAQNVHWEAKGAFTGEISPEFLKELGVSFVVIGHSDRRHSFGESQELIDNRTFGCINSGLTAVVCIGETWAQREAGQSNEVLKYQIAKILEMKPDLDKLVLAYEPVWAISSSGTGKTATLEDIISAHDYIISEFKAVYDKEPRILFGGSVSPSNFAEIVALPQVAGALIGGAAIKLDQYLALIQISEERQSASACGCLESCSN